MQIVPLPPTAHGAAPMFAGDVWYDVLASPQDADSRLKVNMVRFSPGAHTAWHSHARGQTLHVTEGIGYVQSRGGELVEMVPGQTYYTPPGEWHWHGAGPDRFMNHLAIWEGSDDGSAETTWGDPLAEGEYPA
jgi:quercetin dioxygenase-like cupin family protein